MATSNDQRRPLTANERAKISRDRRKASGLKCLPLWIYPEDEASIKSHVQLLTALTKIQRAKP